MLTRRQALTLAATSCLVGGLEGLEGSTFAQTSDSTRSIGFGFSLYGMKNLPLLDALRHCASVGYDCVELPAMADWLGAPERMDNEDRKRFRESLAQNKLRLSALMENLVLVAAPETHSKNLERLKRAAALGHELRPHAGSVVIETVLGGKPTEWLKVRESMAEHLRGWAEVGEQTGSIIAIKAHISGAAHRPEHVRWLLDQVASPSLKAAFDFSHFQLRGIDMVEAWKILANDTVFIHVKDSVGDQDKFQFVLPGEGTVDYGKYFELIRESNYKGDILVEVSGQLHSRPDYDPISACKKSFAIAPKLRPIS